MSNLRQGKMSKGGLNNKPMSDRPPSPPAQGMSPKQAVEVIKSNYPPEHYTMLREALDLAIKYLQPKCDDCLYDVVGENSAIVILECPICGDTKEEPQES